MRRPQMAAERGFTLIELLVTMLIIGILLAIGIGSFLAQRAKAQDADAKTSAVAAAKAMLIFHQDHETFAGADQAQLAQIESSLGRARGLAVTGDDSTFTVSVNSVAGGSFSIKRLAGGTLQHGCSQPGIGGCSGTTDALGNRW